MAIDRAEEQKLENLMTDAEKTGDWQRVSQEVNDRKAGNFAARGSDLDDTVKEAAKLCSQHGFPMTVIEGLDGHVQSIKDNKNSSFLHNVGISEDAGGQYHPNY